ncbi:FAD-dependent oxidoreductase [Enterococcus durans]|uniref:FAD-dependent oxidoreductase n=1 Tax=Enterococcus durans TaxID=53345 RepID=A0A5N0YQ38_9ENTE|nr:MULTISPECIES: FAD-dependent oxidoreductase [Enterococcus]KAA9177448.1 FAD-dependent oxidoreductase [Enterococcus durans]KAA9183987.1 FAD-dependent oxidoreductase [Enterococcus durans]KAA9185135.1 FAD-dependent oxidoreductase [Enterococcus durans]KAA9189290.1 FAD-dependent oxidoreductase [Enterococcus durans]KAA9190915.1 FAD-dependent oxidoreductase [Enterococcus durans]
MEKTKVIIVGASHGGHQSILELLSRYGEDVDITLFEAGDYVSFMSCGMELYLEDHVTDVNDVRNFRPENFPQSNVHILNNHQVTAINADKKTVSVVRSSDDQIKDYAYDKLILSSGVTPNSLPVPGTDLDNVYLMRGYNWATKIKAKLTDPDVKKVAVIGAGYIGIEAAEAFCKAGKEVTLLDVIDRPLGTYLDKEMTDILEAHLKEKGINVVTGAKINAFTGEGQVATIQTEKTEIATDLVIQAAGVKANTEWLKGVVDLDERGWIITDEYLQTNVPDVYAVGDATLAYSVPARTKMPIALATVARREARYVVQHLFEKVPNKPFGGVVGSSALSVFDYHFAASGLNSFTASKAGIAIRSSYYEDTLRPKYVPEKFGNTKVSIQLFFDPVTHQILGGAVLSTYDITAQGNVLALAIQQKLTIEDLAEADFFFQPGFDRQWSMLNLAAQQALGEEPFVE